MRFNILKITPEDPFSNQDILLVFKGSSVGDFLSKLKREHYENSIWSYKWKDLWSLLVSASRVAQKASFFQ